MEHVEENDSEMNIKKSEDKVGECNENEVKLDENSSVSKCSKKREVFNTFLLFESEINLEIFYLDNFSIDRSIVDVPKVRFHDSTVFPRSNPSFCLNLRF